MNTRIKLSLCLGIATMMASLAHASTLYSDNNFTTFPTGWTNNAPTDTSLSVVQEAPASGPNTNSLHLLDNSGSGRATASTIINGGSTLTGEMVLEFDINMSMVMQDPSNTAYNQLMLRVFDSSGITNSAHSALTLYFSRSSGSGSANSRLGFANGSGITSGFFNPDDWYHVSITFSAIGGSGTVATLTGKDNAKVYDLAGNEVSQLTITQAFGNSLTDFNSLFLATGTDSAYRTNANITNLSVSIPESSSGSLLIAGLATLCLLGHRRIRKHIGLTK